MTPLSPKSIVPDQNAIPRPAKLLWAGIVTVLVLLLRWISG